MVDPYNIPKKMSKRQLEYWILFGICVAGKGAKATERKLKALLADIPLSWRKPSPFDIINKWQALDILEKQLKKHRLGQYNRITRAFGSVIDLDLNRISIDALMSISGIGPKTARMIMMYYDPSVKAACLDTHILKYLKALGISNVPKSTPSGKNYLRLEQEFLKLAEKQGKIPQELDTEIWLKYAKK